MERRNKLKLINEKELDSIKGGGVPPVLVIVVVSAVVVFLAGVIDGITNPEKCN